MEVILKKKVKNLGDLGAIVKVKDGYARNWLIPQSIAMPHSRSNLAYFELIKKEIEGKNKEEFKNAEKAKKVLESKDILIIENSGDDGKLYGSVTSTLLASKLNEAYGENVVSRHHVIIKEPIKNIGIYSIEIELHHDIAFQVRVVIGRSNEEIEVLLKDAAKAIVKDKPKKEEFFEAQEAQEEIQEETITEEIIDAE